MSIPTLSTSTVIRVGDGRGFVTQACRDQNFVITAGHCLPDIPPCHGFSYTEERTFAKLLGPKLLGPLGGECTVWAECLFVDPLSDLAVLGSPDPQALSEEAEAYQRLIDTAVPLMVATNLDDEPWREDEVVELAGISLSGDAVPNRQFVVSWQMPAWIFSLDGQWFQCVVSRNNDATGLGSRLWVSSTKEGLLAPGMSGSPIVVDNGINGMAIGVFCLSRGLEQKEGGPQPHLIHDLPGWLLHEFGWHHDGV